MECLSVKGNVYLERHPNYVALLIEYFPNMKELDSENLVKDSTIKNQVRVAKQLSREIIPFVYRLDKII